MGVRELEEDGDVARAVELGLPVELPRLVEIPAREGRGGFYSRSRFDKLKPRLLCRTGLRG